MPKKSTSQLAESDELDEPLHQVEDNGAWKMPTPTRGQTVIFYYRGSINPKNADVGFVTQVGEQSIDIAYRGQGYTECLHRDDPRIVANPDIKNDIGGLWEFTKEQRILELRLQDIEARLDALEAATS